MAWAQFAQFAIFGVFVAEVGQRVRWRRPAAPVSTSGLKSAVSDRSLSPRAVRMSLHQGHSHQRQVTGGRLFPDQVGRQLHG